MTVFGESAGSFSVFSHLMSPQSKGLFRAAIAMSGVTSGAWSVTDKHPAYYTRSLASMLGCDADSPMQDIVKCMKTVMPE